jgi:putative Mg2+ transporter-C (MgtC) family protein
MDSLAALQTLDDQLSNWAASLGWPLEPLFRLTIAAIAGGLVGLEREVRGRHAGFRTNLLVCLGSALVMIVSAAFAGHPWRHTPGVSINIDPARLAYGVMTGVGFIGAGTIMKTGSGIRGLTTAAAMWCVASIGLAAGFGLYLLSILATLLVIAALWVLDYVESLIPRVRYRVVTVRRAWKVGVTAETVERFQRAKLDVIDASFQRTPDLAYADISLQIAFVRKAQYYSFERQLEGDTDYQLLATRET